MPRPSEALVSNLISEQGHMVLRHYSSPYYDPVKAREYYLRTRELKGKEPAISAESAQKQREAVGYVRSEIKTRKTADLTKNAADREAQIEAHQARMQKLQEFATDAIERIEKKLLDKLASIKDQLKIPENASPKLRAFLERQQAKQTRSAIQQGRAEMDSFRKGLRTAINTAREEYRAARLANTSERRNIVTKYQTDLERETQNIKDQVR